MSYVVTIERVDSIALCIPFDHWAPPPLFGGRPRTTLDSLLVRVTASNGLVGWGEACWGGWQASQAAPEHWVAPLAVGTAVRRWVASRMRARYSARST